VISSNLALGDHQVWNSGPGGIAVANLNTNGHLLEVDGDGTVRIDAVVSGTGGLALSGSRLELTGENTYTGGTWVHNGTLVVNGSIADSSGVQLGASGELTGTGTVAALSGSGTVSPGNSPGILTTSSVDPSAGMNFQFEFTSTGSPDYSNASASVNDVLRITGGIPFTQSMTTENEISIFLDAGPLNLDDTFRGGFFTDLDEDFLGVISAAEFLWYVADDNGSFSYNGLMYSTYAGPYDFQVSTVSESADFGGGLVNGQTMQFVVVPEPGSLFLAGLALTATGFSFWHSRRRYRTG